MIVSFGAQAIEEFRTLVGRRLGLRFEDSKLGELSEVLHERMRINRIAQTASYFDRFLSSVEELHAVASRLTVPETCFFRIPDQFRAFVEVVLPQRMRAASRRLELLSAGCATGEEAYSIAMLLRDHVDLKQWQVRVRGVDINPSVIAKAERACYSAWSLRELPDNFRPRYFERNGKGYQLHETVQAMVNFEPGNLLDANSALWQTAHDVIFFRNVLMYFTPEAAQAVMANIARALAPDGYLFLAPAENLRGISHDFHLCHTHGIFYYQRRNTKHTPVPPTAVATRREAPAEVAEIPLAPLLASGDWQENIRKASQRIASLADASGDARTFLASRRAVAAFPATKQSGAPVAALELFKQERYQEALAAIDAVPQTDGEDPDVQLLRAVLQLNAGDVVAAEMSCTRLLASDDLHAGAHYVRALCCEQTGNRNAAVEEDEAAVYLDPSFAMPRLHLGLLAKKAGEWNTARRELAHAALLLTREDSSRILLFGGGFSREALVQLCHAELRTIGGSGKQAGTTPAEQGGSA